MLDSRCLRFLPFQFQILILQEYQCRFLLCRLLFSRSEGVSPKNASATNSSRQDSQASCQSDQCRSEEHTSELQSPDHLVCRLLLEKKKRSTSCGRGPCPRASRTIATAKTRPF